MRSSALTHRDVVIAGGGPAGAERPGQTHVAADFSYRCGAYAGPGFFLAGDAATCLDPIFSTGVCLAMVGGHEVAR